MHAKYPTDPKAEHFRFQITMELDPPDGCPFQVGDKVTYTNENGCVFTGREVIGFTLPGEDLHGSVIYLAKDAFWFPIPTESLELEVDTTDSQIRLNDPCLMGCGLGFNL